MASWATSGLPQANLGRPQAELPPAPTFLDESLSEEASVSYSRKELEDMRNKPVVKPPRDHTPPRSVYLPHDNGMMVVRTNGGSQLVPRTADTYPGSKIGWNTHEADVEWEYSPEPADKLLSAATTATKADKSIGDLAQALHREVPVLKMWEKSGWLAPAPSRSIGLHRRYTSDQVTQLTTLARAIGLLNGGRITVRQQKLLQDGSRKILAKPEEAS